MNFPPPPFAPFPPVPVPPPPGRHPGLYADADGYTRKEVDDRDADTLSAAKSYADGKYALPSSGIPVTDLSSGVQASLGKADTALQEHQSLSGYATEEWVGEQGFLTEHQSLSGYVQKSETSGLLKNDGSVDTNTYLTEHQSLSGYVQKSVLFDNPDTNPMVKSALLPSYVDDVLEYASTSGFPSSGETGKIYVALDTNKTYRWGATEYVQVGGGELPTLATVATTGDYDDLTNKPTIPAAQVNADWNAVSGVAQILNKPTIPSTDGPFTAREEAVASQTREQTSYGKGGAATSDGEGNTWSTALPKNNGTLALQEGIAPAFSSSSTYAVGDYVTHDGLLYKCSTAISTAGAWDATKWSAVSAMAEMPSGGAPSHNIWAASCTSSNGVAYVATPYGGDFSLVDGATIVFKIPMTNAGDPTINVGGTGAKAIYEISENLYWPVSAGTMRTGAFCILQYDSSRSRWNMHGYASINSPVLQKMPMAENLAVGTTPSQNALANGYPSLASGNNSRATGLNSVALGQAVYAGGQAAFACNQGGDAAGFGSFVAGRRSVTAQSGIPGSASSPHAYAFAWQGDVSGGSAAYYHSHGDGTFNINPVPASGSTDPATGFWIGEKKLPEVIAENTNYLPYASTTTLAPETAVYRATATNGVIPAVTLTGIPTSSSYFSFEYEVTVPSGATLDSSNISAWTWVTGKGLPTSDYAGKTIYIKARLDCTARTVRAECYDVA